MSGTGLSAMVHAAAAFENDLAMETLSIGRAAVDDADSVLEIAGRWLCYRVALCGPEVRLAATVMDAAPAPETLLRSPDTESGWDTTRRLIASLERNQIKSLARPIEVGSPGDPDAWVIA